MSFLKPLLVKLLENKSLLHFIESPFVVFISLNFIGVVLNVPTQGFGFGFLVEFVQGFSLWSFLWQFLFDSIDLGVYVLEHFLDFLAPAFVDLLSQDL